MVLQSFFELQFDLFVVRDELLLVDEDHPLGLLAIEQLEVDYSALLLLFRDPVFFLRFDPLGQEFLGLDVSLDQDGVLVKL